MTEELATLCFSCIRAIEQDVREIIRETFHRNNQPQFLTKQMAGKAKQHFIRENNGDDNTKFEDHSALLPYLNLGDYVQLLNVCKKGAAEGRRENYETAAKYVAPLVEIRNRVYHHRSKVRVDDFPTVRRMRNGLLQLETFAWKQLKQWDASSSDMTQSDRAYEERDGDLIHHNLPAADHNDTGFLGRDTEREQVCKWLLGGWPIVEITGEGGIGKTALALQVAYDLLQRPANHNEFRFEQIAWVSFKVDALTDEGVQNIRSAITDARSVVNEIHDATVGYPNEKDTKQSMLAEVFEYLRLFKILLILDNCETAIQDELMTLLNNDDVAASGSKILVTTRNKCAPGQYLGLPSFGSILSIEFMEKLASIFNADDIAGATYGLREKWCKTLAFNPLCIKWFVGAVARGADPVALLAARSPEREELLEFCFQNIFESLSDVEKAVMRLLSVTGGSSQTQLLLMLEEDDKEIDEVKRAIVRLINLSVLTRSFDNDEESILRLQELPGQYIKNVAPPSVGDTKKYKKLIKEQRNALSDSKSIKNNADQWDMKAVRHATQSERAILPRLDRALKLIKQLNRRSEDKVDEDEGQRCLKQLSDCEKLNPKYSEIYRVRAQLWNALDRSAFDVSAEFDRAIEVGDQHRDIAVYTYAYFLIRDAEEYDKAIQLLDGLLERMPDDARLLSQKGKALLRDQNPREAIKQFDKALKNANPDLNEGLYQMTARQLAESYRRVAEGERTKKNIAQAQQNLVWALSTMADAFNRMKLDDHGVYQIAKLLDEAISLSCVDSDAKFAEMYAAEVLKICGPFNRPQRIYVAEQKIQEKLNASKELIPILHHLNVDFGSRRVGRDFVGLSDPRQMGVSEGEERIGVISNLPVDKPYGFLVDEETGKSFYFTDSSLPSGLSITALRPGIEMRFEVGPWHDNANKALNVRLVEN